MSLKSPEASKLKILSSLMAEKTSVNKIFGIKFIKQNDNLIMNTKDLCHD